MRSELPNEAEQAPSELELLMQDVCSGDEDAVVMLVERFGHHILRAIRYSRRRNLRSMLDSADLVQSTWLSFFRDPKKIPHFQRAEQLIAFLAAVAEHKLAEKTRAILRSKRDVRRQLPLDQMRQLEEPAIRCTPSRILLAKERLERLVEGKPRRYQEVICRRAAGETTNEIAQALGIHERTVWKIIEYVIKSEKY